MNAKTVKIYDSNGKLIKEGAFNNRFKANVSAGTYIVSILNENKSIIKSQKIIILND